MLKIFSRLVGNKAKLSKEDQELLSGIDAETLAVAKELAYEKRLKTAVNAKWRGKKATTVSSDDLLDALRSLKEKKGEIISKVFERTVEDTVLSNKFKDGSGNEVRHLTVKKAVAMDGLRDIDDVSNSNIVVSPNAASPMNPEGKFKFPTTSSAKHEFSERFNEAMNPRLHGKFDILPEQILEHFARFSTFIGYPLCEMIATHPTVSNACTIPGQDAIAPGYKIKFVDSEDLDENGIPDEVESEQFGNVKRSLERISAIEALKDAVVAISGKPEDNESDTARNSSIEALARVLERLAAYEEYEKDSVGEDAASSVREGMIEPISDIFIKYTEQGSTDLAKRAISALSLAISDLSQRERMPLLAVRALKRRRDTRAALVEAKHELERRKEEYDKLNALNRLAVAVERVAAYENYSDRNRESLSNLTEALKRLSSQDTESNRQDAVNSVHAVIIAMDSDDFDFEDPTMDGIAKPPAEGKGDGVAENQDTPTNPSEAVMPDINSQDMQMAMAQEQMAAEQQKKEEEAAKKKEEVKAAARASKERQKLLDEWKQRADDMGLNKVCEGIARNARVFGIGIAIPIVDGADYEQPFNLDTVKEGSYKGFAVIEPTWIYPEVESNDLINPLSQSFFEPLYWVVTGATQIGDFAIRRIHRSWMIICRNKEVPNMLRPMYYYGGIPLTQEIYEAVYCADKVMNEVPKLALTKRTVVIKGEPNDLVTNPEGVVERLTAFSQVQDNFGKLYVGRNSDVMQMETSLSEFDQLIAKCNQRVAAIAKMPETKLFKTQLAGMNSAGRYEWDDYSQLLIDIQNNWFKPLLSLHYRLDTKSRNGKVVQIKIDFNPIDVPTQAEKAETESRMLQNINSALQAGWLSAAEARTLARSQDGSMFSSIPAEMPDELEQPQNPMMGMTGGDGGDIPQLPQLGGAAGSPLDAPDAPPEPKEPKERK